jgi:aspartyl-tRNA(Asn)/glutamyl-tRNA(Gln) amidotransferase subunit A
MTDLADLSTIQLATAIGRGDATPLEAVDAALARIERHARYNAFITVTAEQARDAARAAMQHRKPGAPLPKLLGVPYSAKDLIATAGIRTTSGSRLFAETVPQHDAVSITRMKQAGAILIGKTTTPEFGHKPFTEAPLFGRTLNPWNESVTCGGSSGGAAVAALLGMGPLALGTDGGGSIRIPAACCGIVGLKATLGAIPHLQVPDLFAANSFVGPMARSVADVALAFDVLRGADSQDPYGQSPLAEHPPHTLKGLRIAWLPRPGSGPVARTVVDTTSAAATRLAAMGAVVEEIQFDFAALEPDYLVILESGLAARLGSYVPTRGNELDGSLLRTIEKGTRHSAVALQQAAAARTVMFLRVQDLFTRYDLLVSPVMTAPPLPVDQDPHGIVTIDGQTAGSIRGAWYPFTFPMNLTGHPALSLPCGFTPDGLPIGLQIAGPWHSEPTIISIAAALEADLSLQRQPVISRT